MNFSIYDIIKEKSNTNQSIEESYLINEPDIYYNKNKFVLQ